MNEKAVQRGGGLGVPFVSPFGYTHPHLDKKDMCPYCYNEDTNDESGRQGLGFGAADVSTYRKYYEEKYGVGKKFKVRSCHCCGGIFHYGLDS